MEIKGQLVCDTCNEPAPEEHTQVNETWICETCNCRSN